jgi:hypothetical protein
MTDKELLEFAALAAGIEIIQWSGRDVGQESAAIMPHGFDWNPLTDDGDALRLAVKLDMTFVVDVNDEISVCVGQSGFLRQETDGDPYAATRRAITRAAAEIGKTK